MMENPTYKKLVAMLAASVTGNDGRYNHVIKAMREQVDPAIARMTKPQLVEAFSEAVLGIHNREVELRSYDGIDGIIETKHKECLIERVTVGHLVNELKVAPAKAKIALLKNARDVKYKPDRDRTEAIRAEWASGKHESKNSCARDTWVQLGFKTYNTARRQLDREPEPANPKKKK